ncbi:hypothetical protein GCM10018785_42220 [Streptomyces longispororuber]|uniref:Uncharacterized protein n=1 Tax=Streptomyces longispororuber TaxID=68230 RepID=A0A919DPP3_9ACTN|nr:hypothetical protein [Streptomyces longispororuber]GHE69241.1 hypothetical protein GCM10018785_42220 [Streptomyces longispororuber]
MISEIKHWWSLGSAVAALTVMGSLLMAAEAQAVPFRDFRVGVQLADEAGRSGFGTERFTNYANFGNSVSPWAGDSNYYDPDAMSINLDMTQFSTLRDLDFRIGAQANDGNVEEGQIHFTPWASQGGGQTDLVTDTNGYDPDGYRVFLETREWPGTYRLSNFRLSVEAFDNGFYGVRQHTPWAHEHGGRSPFALDVDGYDPDGFRFGLEAY